MIAKCHPVVADDIEGLVALSRDLAVDLVVIGPEVPLVLGLADELRHIGIATFGPGAAAAKMEGSKAFTKQLLDAAGVDTAESYTVTDFAGAKLAIGALGGACGAELAELTPNAEGALAAAAGGALATPPPPAPADADARGEGGARLRSCLVARLAVRAVCS